MAKAKVITSTNIPTAPNVSEITQKMAVDCELISIAVNPMFCTFIGMTPLGEIIFVHRNAEVFVRELLLSLCDALEDEGISPKDKKLIEEVKKILLSKEEHSSQESDTEAE